jgi:hypothetical protein
VTVPSTYYRTISATSTVYTTSIDFVTETVSNVATATDVSYTTTTQRARQRRDAFTDSLPLPTSTSRIEYTGAETQAPKAYPTAVAQVPVATIYAHQDYNAAARRLENMGVVVKRQNTITSTVTTTVSSTTTVFNTITSTISNVAFITSTRYSTITSTEFLSAATTVFVASTITESRTTSEDSSSAGGSASASASAAETSQTGTADSAFTGNDASSDTDNGGDGLSTGAKAGIGTGAGIGGAIIIFGLIFFLWKRHKKNQDKRASFRSSSPNGTGAVLGAGAMEEKQSNNSNRHSYQPVPTNQHMYEADSRNRMAPPPMEMPDNRAGFQYQPYEMYEDSYDRRHELYGRHHER